jgi:microcystin-dependent protein
MGVLRVKDGGQWVDIDTSGSWVPIGTILMFGGPTAPGGFMLCNGNAVLRTTYAQLFSAIGTTWGAGDGSSTFNLPDLRGRVCAGAGTGAGLTARTLGQILGEETHLLTAAESGLPTHGHTNSAVAGNDSPDHSHGVDAGVGNAYTGYQSADHAHNTSATDVVRNVGGGFFVQNSASGYNYNPVGLSTGGVTANHYHYIGYATARHSHGVTVTINAIAAANASAGHNTMQPTAIVNHIIRVS